MIVFSANSRYFEGIDKPLLITDKNYVGNEDSTAIVRSIQEHSWLRTTFHTVLAIRIHDTIKNSEQTKIINTVTSLTDIYATIINYLNIDAPETSSQNLLPLIAEAEPLKRIKPIFFESKFKSNPLDVQNHRLSNYLNNGLSSYHINCCTGTIELKPIASERIRQHQLMGAIHYPHLIIQLPDFLSIDNKIVYDLEKKTWTLMNSSDGAEPQQNPM